MEISIIIDKLNDIDKRLVSIEEKIQYIEASSQKMSNHISFVESVYKIIKIPFLYVLNKIHPIDMDSIEHSHKDIEMKPLLKKDP